MTELDTMGKNNTPDFPVYIPPNMYCNFVICFDADVPFDEISTAIGVTATSTLQYHLTQINPFTHKHNPGYWEYGTEKISSDSCDNLLNQIRDFLLRYGDGFRDVLNRYTGSKLIVRIFLDIRQPDNFPDIIIEKSVMEAILSSGGSLDIVMREDFETEGGTQ